MNTFFPSFFNQNELLQAEQKNVLAQQDFHEMKNVSQAVSTAHVHVHVLNSDCVTEFPAERSHLL